MTARMPAFVAWVSFGVLAAYGQTPASPPAKTFVVPRLADGHPDLQGTYDLETITPLERPPGTKLIMTNAEAALREKVYAAMKANREKDLSGDRPAPPKGGDGTQGAAGGVGGYNTFWLDLASSYTVVDGQKRSSMIVDPADGRVPPMKPSARERELKWAGIPTSDSQEEGEVDTVMAAGGFDDPERRPLGERCLLGFGSTSGPPALPDYLYNNLHQIIQTKDQVVILNEMVHDARIIRMNAQHLPKTIRRWMGDSIGHWEGDTLVVETTNFTDKTRFRGSSENLKVIERFTRTGANTLLYRFTIDDPETWDAPWTGEYTWPATDQRIFEYACHEANYALPEVLSAARQKEADTAASKKQ
jgi:hypothetical protein